MTPDHPTNPPQAATPSRIIYVNGHIASPLTDHDRKILIDEHNTKLAEADALSTQLHEDDEELLADVLGRCMVDFPYWCNNFAYTFDPRSEDPHHRFVLYPFQESAAHTIINAIDQGGIILLEKSRDMGASWLMMAITTWCWLFKPSFHSLIGSRKEKLVDDKTIDSLMGKIDYILARLPPWMTPNYVESKRKMLEIGSENGNLITGESANVNFGRGPRKNMVYLDEFAFWEADRAVWTGVADTAPCRVVTSTPYGEGNEFARLRFDNEERKLITLHWTLHPYKDWDWYEVECAKRSPVARAQELDIDYKASAGGLAFPQLRKHRPAIVCPPFDPDDPGNANYGWFGGFDWGSTNPGSIHIYRVLQLEEDKPIFEVASVWEFYGPMTLKLVADSLANCPFMHLVEDMFCDPTLFSRNQTTTDGGLTSLGSLFQEMYNIYLTPGRRGDVIALKKIEEMWRDPDKIGFKISEDCPNQIREFEGLRYQQLSAYQEQKRNAPERLVDKDNHSFDDFKYFLNSVYSAPLKKQEPPPQLMGYEELNKEFAGLRKKKIEAHHKKKRRRRLFAWN